MESAVIAPEAKLGLPLPARFDTSVVQAKPRLEGLTSLRFLFAMVIVYFHMLVPLGLRGKANDACVFLAQGVSFFFVLSGFILTYQYPQLTGAASVRAFLWARFARIWPAHVVAILLCLFVFPTVFWPQVSASHGTNLLAHLAMVQSCIPWNIYFHGLDPVSWSISTEWVFYLCFPLLIMPQTGSWRTKLLLAFGLAAISAILSASIGDTSSFGIVNPLCRLFEFVLGMATATLWLRTSSKIRLKFFSGSLAEILFLVFFSLVLVLEVVSWQPNSPKFDGTAIWAAKQWYSQSGNAPFYAVMIFLVALQKGCISRLLQNPILVWLGDTSYSIYLFHYFGILYIELHKMSVAQVNPGTAAAVFLFMVLWLARLVYVLVEQPARQWLRSLPNLLAQAKQKHEYFGPAWNSHAGKKLLVAGEVAAFLIVVFMIDAKIKNIDESNFHSQAVTLANASGVRFGTSFTLQSVQVGVFQDGVRLKLSWKTDGVKAVGYFVAVHLLDSNGKILTSNDYEITSGRNWLMNWSSCSHTILFLKDQCTGARAIAIAMYKQNQANLLEVNKGTRDWGGHRLILSLKDKAPKNQPLCIDAREAGSGRNWRPE
jgi:peptidoglycan/LPS O-acetylase OafA/YrhL